MSSRSLSRFQSRIFRRKTNEFVKLPTQRMETHRSHHRRRLTNMRLKSQMYLSSWKLTRLIWSNCKNFWEHSCAGKTITNCKIGMLPHSLKSMSSIIFRGTITEGTPTNNRLKFSDNKISSNKCKMRIILKKLDFWSLIRNLSPKNTNFPTRSLTQKA